MDLTNVNTESLSETAAIHCRNCNKTVSTQYCGHCGTPIALKRVDRHYVVHEIQHVLHFEKGILYTVKELFIRPGRNIRIFLNENRSRLVKPIIFIIITSLLFSTISHIFHQERDYTAAPLAGSTYMAFLAWLEGHIGYGNLIIGAFVAFWLKLLFKKSGYNYFEYIIMLCFVLGTSMLIYSLFALITGLTGVKMALIEGLVPFIYCIWAIGQFFDGKKVASYIKALVAYCLGMFFCLFTALLFGILIDILKK
ncbi:uncharacterized protein DUF3667 [Chitinophaga dinghuensis]|uniref:Uncharacterized protein DUF3667 n=1 Tax=Chitinophaga dinghuensis TaxID=1539050 RepID=A0A327VS56_9BACT|nr:DUF3667 domain-containing protein [Chitinophaga dinghuensis]RAJ77376.1 uncharacterized protein DUF3667 [Chitinophaga dinghuensis]